MTRPNVLLVTVDSLRADHVSACNPESPVETLGIDRVGEEGTTYTDAVAQGPFTTFSMPSLFTSRYPTGLEYVELSDAVVGVYPSDDVTTLTERFASEGYDTGGFHSNPLLSTLFDFDRGFDAFEADLPFAGFELPGRLKLLTNKLRRLLRRHAYLPAEAVTDRATEWLDGRDGGPFFCWVHYMDVHGPYQSKTGFTYYNKYRGERLWGKAVRDPDAVTDAEHEELLATYREEVAYTDDQIGRLLDAVEERTDRPTVEVVTADHGEGFDEHGYYSHPHEVDDELVHVPLLVDDPTGCVDAGTVDAPTELVDVAPTLLDVADVEVPESFEGRSLAVDSDSDSGSGLSPGPGEDATGDVDEGREAVALVEAEVVPDYRGAVRTAEWTYVLDEIRDERRLVDRETGGTVDKSATPDRYAEFAGLFEAHRGRPAASDGATATHEIEDEDVRERLRKLGYVE
jgi:arylsulfatase A-like enzyme